MKNEELKQKYPKTFGYLENLSLYDLRRTGRMLRIREVSTKRKEELVYIILEALGEDEAICALLGEAANLPEAPLHFPKKK